MIDTVIQWLILLGILFLLGRVVWRRLSRPRPARSIAFGSAAWMNRREIRAMTRRPGLIVGRQRGRQGRLLRYDGEAHLLTIAPTRSGKGVGAIIPNLLTAERSVLCIDPKGENARVTARRRRELGPVWVLDPFAVAGQPAAACNPLDAVDPASPDAIEDAATLAEALIVDPPQQIAEAHWNEEAKALLAGIILLVAAEEPAERRTLATVREHLTLAPGPFLALLTRMQASDAVGGVVARAANRHLGKAEREAAGVLSSAQRHTHFLDSPRMTATVARSDFRFEVLKERTATVFLALPPDRIDAYRRWLRLMVAQAITAMARSPARPPSPVLFLLDELAALGRLEPVERAMDLMAGYGLQLWPILQDLHQLRAAYGVHAGSFLANAGLLQVHNVNDADTATWLSRLLGDTTEVYATGSASDSFRGLLDTSSTAGSAEHLVRRPLLTPDEVRRLPRDAAVVLEAGLPPVPARKVRYFADPEFQGLFEPM